MFSRMQTLKSGMVDEDGMGINAVDKALKQVGLTLRDGERGFKDLDDVLEEVGKGWHTYDEFQKSQLVTAIAGVRQANILVALLDNQEMAQKLVTEQVGKDTLAQERYAEVLKGVEAAQNRMRASWEKSVVSSVTSEFIASLFNAGAGILDFIDKIGGIATVLKIVIPLVILFNAAWIKTNITLGYTTIVGLTNSLLALIPALFGATGATGAFTTVLGAANVAALPFVATLALLTAGTMLYASELKKAREEQEKIRTDLQNKTGNVSDNATSYEDYISKAKEAAKAEGYVYDETGKMFKKGYHDLLVYVNGMDLLTEAQWEANQSALKLKNSEEGIANPLEKVSQTAEEAAKSLEELKKQSLEALVKDDSFSSLLKQVVNMLKDIKKQEKENIQQQLSNYKEYIDTLKQGYKDRLDEEKRLYDAQKTNLQRQHEDEKRINDDRIDAIKDELDGYKKILNARQELLKIQKEEAEYNRTKADKESDLAKLEAQILELSFDNSAEGIARRLELEQQAADLRQELADDAADHEFDLQQQALDAEIAKAEEEAALRIKELEEEQKASDLRYEMRLRELEDAQDKSQQEYDTNIRNLENTYAAKEANFQNQIKLIDNYLSQEGLLNKQAMDLILDENSGVYEDLMEWNRVYGTGIQNDIIAMWDLAKVAVDDYKNAIMEVSAISVPTPFPNTGGFTPYEGEQPDPADVIHSHHTGIEKGAVGGKKLKSSEEFIKVLRGEVVITPKQMSNYTNNILPSMMNKPKGESTFSGGGATFEKLFDIVIQGNLDKSTLPDLERLSTQIIDKINKGMQQRGMLRNTNLNAI